MNIGLAILVAGHTAFAPDGSGIQLLSLINAGKTAKNGKLPHLMEISFKMRTTRENLC